MEERNVLSISKTSTLAGVSKDTVRRAIKQGVLQGFLEDGKFGKEYKIYKESFEEWMKGRDGHANGQKQEVIFDAKGNAYGQQGVAYGQKGMRAEGFVTVPLNIFDRLEQAMHRAGWLEGQLELTKRMLTEGQATVKQREENLLKEKIKIEEEFKKKEEEFGQERKEKDEKLFEIEEEKRRLEEEARKIREEIEVVKKGREEEREELMSKLILLNMPWWKKAFYSKKKLEEEVRKILNENE